MASLDTPSMAFVGKSGVGKTTFLEKLIAELKQRGYRVGTIKHNTHTFDIDIPGKDTWRHAQAGSDAVMISSPHKFAMIRPLEQELALEELIALMPPVDIIIIEGHKQQQMPKVEVYRAAVSERLVCEDDPQLVGLVTDRQFSLPLPQFGLEDIAGVADWLEERFDLPARKAARVSAGR